MILCIYTGEGPFSWDPDGTSKIDLHEYWNMPGILLFAICLDFCGMLAITRVSLSAWSFSTHSGMASSYLVWSQNNYILACFSVSLPAVIKQIKDAGFSFDSQEFIFRLFWNKLDDGVYKTQLLETFILLFFYARKYHYQ